MNKELLKIALTHAEANRLHVKQVLKSLPLVGYHEDSVTYQKINDIYTKARRDVNDLKLFLK